MKKIISTPNAPKAIGPYSQAIETGNMLFVSGQIPLNPISGLIENETIASQTNQVLNNLKYIVESAGYTLEHVVKTTCYLTSMENFPVMNEVYATFFPLNPPARVTIEVSRLPKDALVEIDAIAVK